MAEIDKTEVPITGFAPHIEELHEFFRSRGVAFGKPEDLKPFVERLQKDESFRDEMGSMVRAIIYRQRDGLLPAELLGLIVTAVAGTPAEDASEQDRDSVRQMLGFVGGVFRSRWNPGDPVAATAEDKAETEVDVAAASAAASAPADTTTRPMTPIFYQAQVVANGGGEPEAVKESAPTAAEQVPAAQAKADAQPVAAGKTKAARKPESDRKPEGVLPLRGTSEADSGPVLNLAGYAAHGDPVVAFLRGEGSTAAGSGELGRRRSNGRMWVAMFAAVVIAFCAGMFARQWMLTHSVRSWPWHRQAAPTVSSGAATPSAPASPSASPSASPANPVTAQPTGAVGAQGGEAAQPRKPAQVEAARSEWDGGRESASDLGASSSPAAGAGGTTSRPMTGVSKPDTETDTNVADSGEARATAMLGASPALMESHLLFAPEPMYPQTARGSRIQGKVVVVALVGRDGSVVKAQAISGNRSLRAAAEQEVSGRRYRPYVVNDIPMAVRTLVTVDFPPR